jgi:hypothetical protein
MRIPVAALIVLLGLTLDAEAQKRDPSAPQGLQAPQVQQLLPPKVVKTDPLFVSGSNVRDHRDLPEIPDAPPAQATLSFMVPVTLRRLPPPIQRIRVTCIVSELPTFDYSPISQVGSGETVRDLVAGGFRGTIVVGVNPKDGKTASEMKSYRCDLWGHDGSNWGTMSDREIDRETFKRSAIGTVP